MPMPNKLNIALVCNPNRSVVVSACAGSGKTWLLVARLVRILVNGRVTPCDLGPYLYPQSCSRDA